MDLLAGLNKEQAQAVTAPIHGATLIVAGPGSGKTRVLTRRIAHLIQNGVNPGQILAVTFTNKAAKEMAQRTESLLRESGWAPPSDRPYLNVAIGTFHSICTRILRREIAALGYNQDFTIYDTDDQNTIIKGVMEELNISGDGKRISGYPQLNKISAAKNELITPEKYPIGSPNDRKTRDIYALYQKVLKINNALDFDDLLVLPVQLFRHFPEVLRRYQSFYRYILVDEFQDTNTAQYVFLKLLAGESQNLFVVGDPDQSVYRFRGAVPKNVTHFRNDFKNVRMIQLGQNYRSHQLILDAATAVIRQNQDHIPITLSAQDSRKTGPKIILQNTMTEQSEAQYVVEQLSLYIHRGVEPRECAVMYRTNAQSRALEEAFVHAKLPYRLVGATRFYARKEIKDLLAYLRVIYNPDDTVNLLRIINYPPRGIGDKSIKQLEAWALERGQSAYSALLSIKRGEPNPLTGRSEKSVIQFASLIETWHNLAPTQPVGELLDDVIKQTRLTDYLDKDDPESEDRIGNINELRAVAAGSGDTPLGAFLEEISLTADASLSRNSDDAVNAPTLLTLHAAKGLEFEVVFITGLEEEKLPYKSAIEDKEQMAEERRLMYVGITRAKRYLHLIWVIRRSSYGGQADYSAPSRFLFDIPRSFTEGSSLPISSRHQAQIDAHREATTWSRPSAAQKLGITSPVAPPTPRPPTPPVRPRIQQKFQAGDKVQNPTFGSGVVISSTIRGEVEELFVKFENNGGRRISADYVEFEK